MEQNRNGFVVAMQKRCKAAKHKNKKEKRKSGKNKYRDLLKDYE